MGIFGQMGDMYKLQREAKKIKEELAKTHISAEENGVKIVINGEQHVISVEFLDESILSDSKKLGQSLTDAFNRAVKKAQTIAAEKMKPILGNFPGLNQQ